MSMYTLLSLKISGYYGMYPNKQTDSISLLFFSDNINRIIFPLCLNVIMMVYKGDENTKTILEKIFGINMQNQVFVYFNNYCPLILILCVIINWFNFYLRLGKCLGLDNFYIEGEKRDNDILNGYKLLMEINKNNFGEILPSTANITDGINSTKSSIHIDFEKN